MERNGIRGAFHQSGKAHPGLRASRSIRATTGFCDVLNAEAVIHDDAVAPPR